DEGRRQGHGEEGGEESQEGKEVITRSKKFLSARARRTLSPRAASFPVLTIARSRWYGDCLCHTKALAGRPTVSPRRRAPTSSSMRRTPWSGIHGVREAAGAPGNARIPISCPSVSPTA